MQNCRNGLLQKGYRPFSVSPTAKNPHGYAKNRRRQFPAAIVFCILLKPVILLGIARGSADLRHISHADICAADHGRVGNGIHLQSGIVIKDQTV